MFFSGGKMREINEIVKYKIKGLGLTVSTFSLTSDVAL